MKRAGTILVLAAVSALALAGTGSAAGGSAKAGPKSCPDDAFCVWTGKNYRGERFVATETGLTKLPPSISDRVSSAKDRYAVDTAYLHDTKAGGGELFCMDDGDKIPDFSAFSDPYNNVASSIELPLSAPTCI